MKKVILDIDGCITDGKGESIDLVALELLKQKIHQTPVSTTLCTGRPAVYVESIAQMLDIQNWCICENGAYLYHTVTENIIYHPNVIQKTRRRLQAIKNQLTTDDLFPQISKIELGKEICISLNPIDIDVAYLYKRIKEKFNDNDLNITFSTTAVDITPQNVNKGSGLLMLSELEGFDLSDTIGVGDAKGDLPFLELCQEVYCSCNAIDSIKKISANVSTNPSTKGLIEIYEKILESAI
ncbi:MAG: HAD family phosphatase [Pasteurella sp.]|nr:HAD family phosphatase [Pasteurella sp.]